MPSLDFRPEVGMDFAQKLVPPISDMENSKIKVSWPNKTVAGLSEVPNKGDFQEICSYWSGVHTGFSPCLARCSNILSLWQISATSKLCRISC